MEKLNFKSRILIDDLTAFQEAVDFELLTRMKLIIGNFRSTGASFGIVSELDPVNASGFDKPLAVVPSVASRISVSSGLAVTESGELIQLSSPANDLDLVDLSTGAVNLVVAEFALEDVDQRPSTYDEQIIAARSVRKNPISVVKLSDFNNPAKFDVSRKSNVILLAAVTVVKGEETDSPVVFDVDTSRSIYSNMRPWFSPVDIGHRSSVGSGEASDKNPHGLSFSDLSSGSLTIYQQMLSSGIIISKDCSVPNVSGCITTESFPKSSIKTDTTGSLTGRAGALYLELGHYPTQIGAVYETEVIQNKIAAEILPQTNIVVLSPADVALNVTVRYFYVKALEPPVTIFNNTLSVLQPNPTEIAIAGGREFGRITTPSVKFDNSGPIPKRFRVFLDKTGELVKNPAVLLPAVKLVGLVAPYTLSSTLYGESKIIVGMTAANSGSTVVLKVIGKNISGDQISENLTFDSSWTNSSVPQTFENPTQFVQAENLYKSLTSIEVVSRDNDGPASTIIVYADASSSLYESLPIMEVHWDGLAVRSVKDIRNAVPFLGLQRSVTHDESPIHAAFLINTLDPGAYTSTSYKLFSDDFEVPAHLDMVCDNSAAIQPTGSITIDNSVIANNDTITVAAGKTVTAKRPQVFPLQNTIIFNEIADVKAARTVQDLTFTAKQAGSAGNSITITYANTAPTAGFESAVVTGNSIVVSIKSGQTTANQLYVALTSNTDVNNLVTTNITGNVSAVQTAPVGPTSLSGGATNQLTATVAAGEYESLEELAGSVATAFNAAPGHSSVYTVTLSGSAFTLTSDLAGGSFILPFSMAANAPMATLLGFPLIDRNGASHTSTIPVVVANAAIGQFAISTDPEVTRNGLIAAVNDPTFASTVTAAAGSSVSETILTASTWDANFELTKTDLFAGGIAVKGFKNGFKLEKGLIWERFQVGLNSLPPGSSPESVQDKYRSLAVHIKEPNCTKLLVLGYGVERLDAVYGKYTTQARGDVWQPKVLGVSGPVNSVQILTFPEPIAKVSLEVFGKLAGISVYAIL